jgi:hypothetical protein
VDHQVEEPLHLCLEGELLGLLGHASLLSLRSDDGSLR